MMPRRRKHEQIKYCYILYYTHECVVCRLFLETYIALNDAKALKTRKSNHFLKVTHVYKQSTVLLTFFWSPWSRWSESSSFLIISSKIIYWLCGAEPVAGVLDGPHSHLIPLSGVAVQASHASLHTLEKRVAIFPSPAGMSLTKLSPTGNN
jgi:hypothetical protein